MGQLTLDQLQNELLFDLRNRGDTGTTGVSSTRTALWINWAYRHISHPSVHRQRPLQYSFTRALITDRVGTEANRYNYALHGSVKIQSVRSVTFIQATTNSPTAARRKLSPRDIRWFDERSITTGPPKVYAPDGNDLFLDASPGSNETGQLLFIRGWRQPADLTASTTTVLDDVWDEVILLGARWRAERDLGYADLAELTKQQYAALINEYADRETLEAEDWGFQPDIANNDTYQESS